LPDVENPVCHAAMGVAGTISDRSFRIGKAEFAGATAADAPANAVFLACDERCIARFDIADQARHDAAETIEALRSLGLGLSIVSGDSEAAVRSLAASLHISRAHANCSPDGKLRLISQLQERGECVVMVGDGINDAPVLAGADVSIAPGRAAMLAQTSADIVMLGESLRPVLTALRLARATMRTVRQNLGWAIGYNALALPLAAGGMIPPWLAAIGMSMSSLVVVLNALRLSRFR
jgi:Cu2+-exporting ATPase